MTFGQCYKCGLSLPVNLLRLFIAKLNNGQIQRVKLCENCLKIVEEKNK